MALEQHLAAVVAGERDTGERAVVVEALDDSNGRMRFGTCASHRLSSEALVRRQGQELGALAPAVNKHQSQHIGLVVIHAIVELTREQLHRPSPLPALPSSEVSLIFQKCASLLPVFYA
jgi:hypothetical protein